jgi:hypothetical protein
VGTVAGAVGAEETGTGATGTVAGGAVAVSDLGARVVGTAGTEVGAGVTAGRVGCVGGAVGNEALFL